MKPIIKTIEELYSRREATGEVLLDEMVNCLRRTRIIAVADLAALMDVNAHQLNMAVHLLTGMTTRDVINRWRLLQAQDLLRQGTSKPPKMNESASSMQWPVAADGVPTACCSRWLTDME